MAELTDHQRDEIRAEFDEAVNMTPKELQRFLDTDESKEVGWKGSGGGRDESVGHEMGRHIVEIKTAKKGELTDEQYAQMRKVVSYVHRHLAQGGPDEDAEHSRWRYSLMNWGHDPLKKGPHPTKKSHDY